MTAEGSPEKGEKMATINTLAALTGAHEERDRQIANRDRPKAEWFKVKENEPLTVKFLQELDPSAENYNPEFGTFLGATEHSVPREVDPNGFMKRALDTMDTEGRDLAAEIHDKDRKAGWGAQQNFYINVAVETPEGPKVQILSRKLNSNFVKDLVEIFEDEGGITGIPFVITRRGNGPQTEIRIKKAKSDQDFDVTGLEPWNLDEYAVRKVPYDQQEEFYFRGVDPEVRDRILGRVPAHRQDESASVDNSSEEEEEYTW